MKSLAFLGDTISLQTPDLLALIIFLPLFYNILKTLGAGIGFWTCSLVLGSTTQSFDWLCNFLYHLSLQRNCLHVIFKETIFLLLLCLLHLSFPTQFFFLIFSTTLSFGFIPSESILWTQSLMDNLLRGIHVNKPTGNQGSDCMCVFMSEELSTHI